MADNPFGNAAAPKSNPYEGLTDQIIPQIDPDSKSLDITARTAALALHDTDEITRSFQDLTDVYKNQIIDSGDRDLRIQAAAKQQSDEFKAIMSLTGTPGLEVDPKLQEGMRLAANDVVNNSVQNRQEAAMEQMALRKIKDLAAEGDYVQAKLLMNQVRYGNAENIINDINTKRMIIHREVEKAQVAQQDQGWFRSAVDFVMSMVGDATLNSALDRSHIVDIDKSMTHWYDWLFSGQRQRNEAAALWQMRPDDFSRSLRDTVIPRIKDHSSFFGYTSQSEFLDLLSGMENTPSPVETNFKDALNVAGVAATLIPLSKINKIPSVLMYSGARKEAANVLAQTSIAEVRAAGGGVKASGVVADEVAEHTLPGAMNPDTTADPQTGDTLAALERGKALLAKFGEWTQTGRLTQQELAEALTKEEQALRMEMGRPLKDFKVVDIKTDSGATRKRFEFIFGKQKGGGYATKTTATEAARRDFAIAAPDVFQEADGQWFIKDSRDLNEAGYYSTQLKPGLEKSGWIGRFLLGSRQIDDELIGGMSRQSANTRTKILNSFYNAFHKDFVGVQGVEREQLKEVMAWGENNSTWLSRDEFDELFSRLGSEKPPSEGAWKAYTAARDVNDIEYVLRNDVEHIRRTTKGFETASFDIQALAGGRIDRENALIARTAPSKVPNGRVYDVETGTHYHSKLGNQLTVKQLQDKMADGYVLVTLEKEEDLLDNTTVKHFLMNKSRLEAERLRPDQLPYRAGGHRLYADKYFVKQAVYGKQADTGEEFLKNPATYISGSKAEVKYWAETMEKARQYLVTTGKAADPTVLDEILSTVSGIDGEDFIRMMDSGELQKSSKFHAVFDRELPEEYINAEQPLDFVDIEETGFTGWLRTNGRMYYSSKGEALHDWQWERARTVDPFETTNTALQNIANISSFSDYKISAVERWVNTYRRYLNTGGLPDNASALTIFSDAKYNVNADRLPLQAGERIKQKLEAQRDIIKRNLGWKTEYDRAMDRYALAGQDFIMGEDPFSGRHKAGRELTEWWSKTGNPLSKLRGLAFDMKLGLFNAAQFPLQIQTLVQAVALHPRLGFESVVNIPAVRGYIVNGSEEFLDTIAKRAVKGGMTTEEYKDMIRSARQSGFFEHIDQSHQLVGQNGMSAVTGGFPGAWDSISQKGRFFFNEGELWNRIGSWQIAWRESMEAGLKPGSEDFLRRVALRADDYSLNMMKQSSAMWQHGLLSVPTQFWAYNARMLEAMLGKQFTREQRMRLFLAQTFFYGAQGAPLVSVGTALWNAHKGEAPKLNSPEGFLQRGMIDEVIWNTLGADVQAGKRYSTGTWLSDMVGEMFGMSPYGEHSVAQFLGGATGSIVFQAWEPGKDTLLDLTHMVLAENGAKDYPLAQEDFTRLAKQISTYSYAYKAYTAWKYGLYESNTGTTITTDVSKRDAFWIGLGIPPGDMDDVAALSAHRKHHKELVDEAAKFYQNKRVEYMEKPDKRAEIAAEVAAHSRLLDDDVRIPALRRAQRNMPESLKEGLARQLEREKAQRDILNGETN